MQESVLMVKRRETCNASDWNIQKDMNPLVEVGKVEGVTVSVVTFQLRQIQSISRKGRRLIGLLFAATDLYRNGARADDLSSKGCRWPTNKAC
jgi:hypothetical protein